MMIVDYCIAKECENKYAWLLCHKCGKCGREFDRGIMIDDGGTHEVDVDDDE